LSFDFYLLEAEPEYLTGGRAYDNDRLNADLAAEGESDWAAPEEPQDPGQMPATPLRRYARRWRVERFLRGCIGSAAC